MNNSNNNIRSLLAAILAMALVIAACKKEAPLEGPDRLFRPVNNGQLEAGGNWIRASWLKIKGAKGYVVELSADSFKTVLHTQQVDTTTYTFNNLKWNHLYQVQVRALAEDATKNSGNSNLGVARTPRFPTILKTPTAADATDEAIRVSWTNSGAAVTAIKVLRAGDSSLVKEVALNATDVSNTYKIINGLASDARFIVYLYSGTSVRGWDDYTTKAPLSGTIIDLRAIEERPLVLQDTIPVLPNGAIVLLKRGATYEIAAGLNLSRALTITSGTDLLVPDPATIVFSGNFNVAAGSNIEHLTFRDLNLRGTDYTSKYVFNVSAASSIGSMSFDNCTARVFRGMVRLQTAVINITNFTVDNSVMDSIGNYGVVAVDNVNCKIENITIKNSTIFRTEKVITSRQNSTTVLLDGCTVHEAPLGGNYLIDYSTSGTNNVTNGIKVYNNIFGTGKVNASGVSSVRGYRANANTGVDVSNTFTTSDYVSASNPFPNTSAYTRPSADLFTNPAAGNFKIKDNAFSGLSSSGDPRWRL